MRAMFTVLILLGSLQSFAAAKNTNVLAVGQGISSPTSTSTINFSSGYTSENPMGTIYQNGFRLTGEYDSNDNSKNYGAELGYGQGSWGAAVGHRKPDCSGCDGTTAGAVGIDIGGFGLGLRFGKELYAVGLLFNPQGQNRFGLMGEVNNAGSDVTAYGFGYSYVGDQITFSVDASARSFEDKTIDDDRIQITPGLMLRADILQLSINDRITLNRDRNNPAHDDKDHDVWFGIGFGGDSGHVALYSHYVNDFALAATLFF